ncbi:uncharacterized protein LOC135812558 [Sycon ciliatum]|uniref:uncharacterized protein LOC135812558 n=1 Tax=Sycon ciliatum TaxID=27933 RepID=UPI0020AC6577|eukprot:scpid49334/ scgid26550/ 
MAAKYFPLPPSGGMSSMAKQKQRAPKTAESLLEYEDYLVICCPKCFGFPSAASTCCRPQLSATGSDPTATPGTTSLVKQTQADSSTADQGSSTESTSSIPAPSRHDGDTNDVAARTSAAADASMLSTSTESSRNLALLSCSLPPRRDTQFSIVHEEIDDFEYDEGNRFIRDRDL